MRTWTWEVVSRGQTVPNWEAATGFTILDFSFNFPNVRHFRIAIKIVNAILPHEYIWNLTSEP